MVFERLPDDVAIPLLVTGSKVLAVTGPALAYDTGQDDLFDPTERGAAAELMRAAVEWGEIYNDIGPGGHIDAEENLSELLVGAMEAGLLLYGACVETTVRNGEERHLWPVGYLRLRRAANVAAEQTRQPPQKRGPTA